MWLFVFFFQLKKKPIGFNEVRLKLGMSYDCERHTPIQKYEKNEKEKKWRIEYSVILWKMWVYSIDKMTIFIEIMRFHGNQPIRNHLKQLLFWIDIQCRSCMCMWTWECVHGYLHVYFFCFAFLQWSTTHIVKFKNKIKSYLSYGRETALDSIW